MLTQDGISSGPSTYYRCSCGKLFEADVMVKRNVVRIMALEASDSRGGQRLAPRLVPKCPKCGYHRQNDPAPSDR